MFGKKTTADELLKLFSALSDEEKEKFLGAVNNESDAEPDTDSDPDEEVEEKVVPPVEDAKETEEEPVVTPTEGEEDAPAEETPTEGAPEEEVPGEDAPAEDANPDPDPQAQDNFAEVLEGFGTRLTAIEESIKGLEELKEQMQKYTQAQADKFGYNGTVPGGKTEFKDMSAAEMKNKILNGEI